MHYQHRYHAGNFADVFKHALLCALLRAHNGKDRPWCYLETHAGAGRYDLGDAAARTTAEFHDGIARLYGAIGDGGDVPPALRTYLDIVRAANEGGPLRVYPGSPVFALQMARERDRVLLCERVPAIVAQLRDVIAHDPRAHLHQRDGYESVALLPPQEKRGLILIDPPFERPDEFDACGRFLRLGLQRFGAGVFAVWYPLKNRHLVTRWLARMRRELAAEALDLQITVGRPADGRMRGCGMLVFNPPYTFTTEAAPLLAWLGPRLAQDAAAATRIEPWPRRVAARALSDR